MRPTLVIAAVVGVVSLLLPLYSLLVRACWQRGYSLGFLDPPQWWTEQKAAWSVVRNAIRRNRSSASSGQPDYPDYLGSLLAALMLQHFGEPIPLPMLARIRQVTRLDAATDTGPDEPPDVPLGKVLTELHDKVQVNAQAANAGRAAAPPCERHRPTGSEGAQSLTHKRALRATGEAWQSPRSVETSSYLILVIFRPVGVIEHQFILHWRPLVRVPHRAPGGAGPALPALPAPGAAEAPESRAAAGRRGSDAQHP